MRGALTPTRACALTLLLSLLSGCDTIQPLRPDAGSRFGPGDAAWPMACESDEQVQALVFRPSCGGSDCHDADRPKAGLDLSSSGLSARLLDSYSVHEDCQDRLLITPGIPPGSLLMEKVLGLQGDCGDPMPALGDLDPEARRCIAQWIESMPTEAR